MQENPVAMPQAAHHPQPELKHILEAVLLAAGEPLSVARLQSLFETQDTPTPAEITHALEELATDLQGRGIELNEVASGYRLKTRAELMPWISRLWEERPQRYSRALLETLSLIAYRQPITRGEIEEVRGVSVSSSIVRTLQEREWIRVVGHRDVPGKPALFGTTRAFLDYFDLKSLDDLPTLAEIRDMANLEPEFDFDGSEAANSSEDDPELVDTKAAPEDSLTETGDNPGYVPAEGNDTEDEDDPEPNEGEGESAGESDGDISGTAESEPATNELTEEAENNNEKTT
jgi:segregation and condensation protein B